MSRLCRSSGRKEQPDNLERKGRWPVLFVTASQSARRLLGKGDEIKLEIID